LNFSIISTTHESFDSSCNVISDPYQRITKSPIPHSTSTKLDNWKARLDDRFAEIVDDPDETISSIQDHPSIVMPEIMHDGGTKESNLGAKFERLKDLFPQERRVYTEALQERLENVMQGQTELILVEVVGPSLFPFLKHGALVPVSVMPPNTEYNIGELIVFTLDDTIQKGI